VRRVVLLRHCEATGPAPDAPLTTAGRAQAAALVDRLLPLGIDHVVSSPFARARESIAPFAQAAGLSVAIDSRLAERRVAAAPVADLAGEVRRAFADLDHRLPGGESAREAEARGCAVVGELLASAHRVPLAVTHGQLLALMLRAIDDRFGFADWRAMTSPDVVVVEVDARGRRRFDRLGTEHAGVPRRP
jgi:2,3-bisphosphoglycerate-dependent phosphoglycerate mutase